MAASKRIALFGGSFNPPHAGHYEIARRLAKRRGIDEVWILPVHRHAFGKKMPSFSRRLKACLKFFRPLGRKVLVKGFEKRRGGTGYTVDLLNYLRGKFPGARFSLAIGADAYRERKLWKDFEKIRKMARLIVFPRGPKSPIPNVSSTAIRALKAKKRLR
ncbi:MAG TPA: nicotinate-nicotinamide nucleotide adenylyltransferase [bacterium]|nr:nicotinate-nicotinamide nucleotide adenylyltransferase [bacterium]